MALNVNHSSSSESSDEFDEVMLEVMNYSVPPTTLSQVASTMTKNLSFEQP